MAKKKAKAEPGYNIALWEGEQILHTAAPGKAANLFFLIPALVCVAFIIALLTTSAWAYIKDYIPAGHTTVTIAAVLAAAATFLIMMRFVVMGRYYIVTNERVIVTKGKGRRSQMFLDFDDIYGVSINQNFLYRVCHLADIDFHSPSSQPRTKAFIIISFTSTVFKFNFLSRDHGVEMYRLLEKLLAGRRQGKGR